MKHSVLKHCSKWSVKTHREREREIERLKGNTSFNVSFFEAHQADVQVEKSTMGDHGCTVQYKRFHLVPGSLATFPCK